MNCTNLDHRIGYLNSGKFYAYVGLARVEVMGTREEVETALGLSPKTVVAKRNASSAARDYMVSVTPRFASWDVKPYDVTVTACDRAGAIALVRAEYRENVQWTNGHATYHARLA